jgi:hypothetical protein
LRVATCDWFLEGGVWVSRVPGGFALLATKAALKRTSNRSGSIPIS